MIARKKHKETMAKIQLQYDLEHLQKPWHILTEKQNQKWGIDRLGRWIKAYENYKEAIK